MSGSIREQILAAMLATLTDATPAGNSVARSFQQLVTRAHASKIIIAPADNQVKIASAEADHNMLLVDVEISVRGDPWDTAADAIAVPAHAALMAWAQSCPLFNSMRLEHEMFEAREADLTAGVLTLQYRFHYLSAAADLTRGV